MLWVPPEYYTQKTPAATSTRMTRHSNTLNPDANHDCRKIYIIFAQFFRRTDRCCITESQMQGKEDMQRLVVQGF